MPLKNRILVIVTAAGLGLSLGWTLTAQQPAPAQPAANGNVQLSPAEYQLYMDFTQATTTQTKIIALDAWRKAFPDSAAAVQRDALYLETYTAANMNRELFDKAVEILKIRPNDLTAINVVLTRIYTINPPPPKPADVETGQGIAKRILDNLDAIFLPANKTAGVTDAQWAGYKAPIKALAQRLYAWSFVQQQNYPQSEVEVTKYLQLDGTQALFSTYLGAALIKQAPQQLDKHLPGIYQFARAAAYAGPNSLNAANRAAQEKYAASAFKAYHCRDDGAFEKMLATAQANVFPPADFKVKTCKEFDDEEAAEKAAKEAADPIGTFWRQFVKEPLTKDDGPAFFEMTLKGAGLPGGVNGLMKLKAKLISMKPATKPKELVLGLEKGDVADTILEFDEALPGTMEPGAELEFSGAPKAFAKEPFTVTFDVDKMDLVGWTGKNAPAGKGPAKGPAKGSATKAKAPATQAK